MTDPYVSKPTRWNRNRPWHKRGGGPSVYLTEDLFLRIVARYCSHIRIARVNRSYGIRLEPFRAEWGMPKSYVYNLELTRAMSKEPAGPFWRVYWDGTERYCGSLRIPTYGFVDSLCQAELPTQHEMSIRREV